MTPKQIKYLKSLHRKKNRYAEGVFLVEGYNLVSEAISTRQDIIQIFVTDQFTQSKHGRSIEKQAMTNEIKIFKAKAKAMERVSQNQSSPGVLAALSMESTNDINTLSTLKGNVLAFDEVSDPGNLGTLVRSAAWFGVDHIVLSKNCVDIYNSKVLKSSMGALFYMKTIIIDDLVGAIEKLKSSKRIVLGADMSGDSVASLKLGKKSWVLVVGSEAHGISDGVSNEIDKSVGVEGKGFIESLNVASAGSVLLSQLCK